MYPPSIMPSHPKTKHRQHGTGLEGLELPHFPSTLRSAIFERTMLFMHFPLTLHCTSGDELFRSSWNKGMRTRESLQDVE